MRKEIPIAIRKQQEMAVLKANMRCSNLIMVVEFSVQTKNASNVGLNRTGHMSFLTGQDPNLLDRSCRTGLNPDLYFKHFT